MEGGMKESALEKACLKIARDRGFELLKLTTPAGIPDRILIHPEYTPAFCEFKSEAGRLSEAQKAQVERLLRAGYRVKVIRTIAEFHALLKEMEG
jgi:hypothetical protein